MQHWNVLDSFSVLSLCACIALVIDVITLSSPWCRSYPQVILGTNTGIGSPTQSHPITSLSLNVEAAERRQNQVAGVSEKKDCLQITLEP